MELKTNKAIFLDRDGVINKLIFDNERDIYRPPWSINEVELIPFVIESLKKLSDMEYILFVITNQPDFVKGLVSIDSLREVKQFIFEILAINKIYIRNDYYCWHHPDYCTCECRKPSPYFLIQAKNMYNLNLKKSWMIGDRNTDIVCGINAGTKTIKIGDEKSNLADFTAKNLEEAVEIIKFCEKIKKKKEN